MEARRVAIVSASVIGQYSEARAELREFAFQTANLNMEIGGLKHVMEGLRNAPPTVVLGDKVKDMPSVPHTVERKGAKAKAERDGSNSNPI